MTGCSVNQWPLEKIKTTVRYAYTSIKMGLKGNQPKKRLLKMVLTCVRILLIPETYN